MEVEDMILENKSTKIKHIVIPMPPKTKAGIWKRYAGDDRSPVLDNSDLNLPHQNLGGTEGSNNFFQPATPQEEISGKRTADVRVGGWPFSGTKAKHTANAMVSRTNTDIPRSETEQKGLLAWDCSDLKLDPSIPTMSKKESLLIQPGTPNLGSETSVEGGIEEPFIPKSLLFNGVTNTSGSFVLPGRGPFYCKAGTRESYVVESDVPEFNLSPEGEEKLTVRIIYDTDIKTVISAQDLIAPIEKRAERLEIIRTADTGEHLPITI